MLMILARLGRSESFWAVVKVRSPHTGPEVSYPRNDVVSVSPPVCLTELLGSYAASGGARGGGP